MLLDIGVPESDIDYDIRTREGAHKLDIYLKNENIGIEINGPFGYLHDP